MADEAVQTTEAPEAAAAPAGAQVASAAPQVAETTETAPEVASYWPEDWRDRLAGNADPKLRQHLNRFTTPEGIFKQWRNYEKQRNNGTLKPTRPDTDDAAALAAWRKEVGLPETAEGYFAHVGREVAEAERPAMQRMFSRMHDIGVPPEQAKGVIDEYYRMVGETEAEREKTDSEFYAKSMDELRAEWGPEYRQNIGAVSIMFQQYGSEDLYEKLNSARFADGTKVADDPGVMKFLASMAREMVTDGVIINTPNHGVSGPGTGVEDELAALRLEMSDTKGREPGGYWNNEGKQKRYAELLQSRERMQRRRA